MMRELGLRILLLALPFAIFWLYLFLIRWRPGHAPPKTPWTILFIIGLSLFAASFLFWRFNETVTAEGTYVPPHMEDGKVVPGRTDSSR